MDSSAMISVTTEMLNEENYFDLLQEIFQKKPVCLNSASNIEEIIQNTIKIEQTFQFDLDKYGIPLFSVYDVSPDEILCEIIDRIKNPKKFKKINEKLNYIYDFPWEELLQKLNELKQKNTIYLVDSKTINFSMKIEVDKELKLNFNVCDCSVKLLTFPLNVSFYSILMFMISRVTSCIPNKLSYYVGNIDIDCSNYINDFSKKLKKQNSIIRSKRFVDNLKDFDCSDFEIYDYIPNNQYSKIKINV